MERMSLNDLKTYFKLCKKRISKVLINLKKNFLIFCLFVYLFLSTTLNIIKNK